MTPRHPRLLLAAALALLPTAAASSVTPSMAQMMAAPAATVKSRPGQNPMLSPQQLKAALAHKNFTLINVHVPYEGRLAGTDLSLPFDTIGQSPLLPKNRAAPLVLYCRSGRMSAIARQTLQGEGYTNVRELQGGFDAWAAAGFRLLH